MDYEKAYKEALSRAKYLKENTDSVGALDVSTCFEQIFPELRESEDEKIRKDLINYFRDHKPLEHKEKEVVAWLEKQSEQKQDDKVDALMTLDEAIEHCKEKSCGNNACALEHKQLAEWLSELKKRRNLNSLSEEPVSEGLDKLVISLEETIGTSPFSRDVIREHLQKAAEWQKKKDKQLVGATQKISHQHGYDEGRFDMMEEMMKDAVDGIVGGHTENPAWIDLSIVNKPKVSVGDKVKLIIVKENIL